MFDKPRTRAEEDDQELLDDSDQALEDHVSAGGRHDSVAGAGSTQLEDVHSGGAEEEDQADVELAVSDQDEVIDAEVDEVLASTEVNVLEVISEDVCE